MQHEFLILVPPVLVLVIAFFTKSIRGSLIFGIISGALILQDFCVPASLNVILERLMAVLEVKNFVNWEGFWSCSNIFTLLFLLVLGVIIVTLERSGSAFAYGNFIKQKVKSARSVELSSLFLSLFFFIDDYFSSLTVGSVMQSVTDIFKIPRAKLGLLVSAVAAPIAIIFPISSWVATISGQFREIGISTVNDSSTVILSDPFFAYLKTIPFLFYAFVIVLSLWFIVIKRASYGVLAMHEHEAVNGNLFGGKSPVNRTNQFVQQKGQSSLFDFIFPIGFLIVLSVLEILRDGQFFLFGGNNGLIEVFASSHIQASLFRGSFLTIFVMIIYFLIRGKLKLSQVPRIVLDGIKMMISTVFVLILIWTFSGMLRYDLQIGSFIANNFLGFVSIGLLPFIFFMTAAAISALIGTAWGSFGLLIPIGVPTLVVLTHSVTPINPCQLPILYPLLGAIISGAVAGTHLSPISDVVLMAATSSGCYHMDLVKIQTSIAVPAIISSATAFLLVGLLIQNGCSDVFSFAISILVGVILNFLIIFSLSIIQNKFKK